jgi:hypothetical protein
MVVAALLVTVGSTLPSWGPARRLSHPRHTVERLIIYLRLRPLWRDLVRVLPQVRGPVPVPWSIRSPLYRRVIEILDGLLLLRPHMDPQIAQLAPGRAALGGRPDDDQRTMLEAASVRAGVGGEGPRPGFRRGSCDMG